MNKFYIKRWIDINKPVEVFRNLTRKCWSVRQRRDFGLGKPQLLTCMYASNLYLRDVKFVVSTKGRQRTLDRNRKTVHAFLKGFIVSAGDIRESNRLLNLDDDENFDFSSVYYNPKKVETFVDRETSLPVLSSDFADLDINDRDNVIAIWKRLPIIE